jgi:hypothetical protein
MENTTKTLHLAAEGKYIYALCIYKIRNEAYSDHTNPIYDILMKDQH